MIIAVCVAYARILNSSIMYNVFGTEREGNFPGNRS